MLGVAKGQDTLLTPYCEDVFIKSEDTAKIVITDSSLITDFNAYASLKAYSKTISYFKQKDGTFGLVFFIYFKSLKSSYERLFLAASDLRFLFTLGFS